MLGTWIGIGIAVIVLALLARASIRIVTQYERGVRFRLGKVRCGAVRARPRVADPSR